MMALKEKLAQAGAEKLADILSDLYESKKELKPYLDLAFASLDGNPKPIISMVKKKLSGLKRSSRFIDYYQSHIFSGTLEDIRHPIVKDLHRISPKDAFKLIRDFLDLHEQTLNRVDDSNGDISGVFVDAFADLGAITAQLDMPIEDKVDLVYEYIFDNPFSIFDNAVINFKDALQDEGLLLLRERLEKHTLNKQEKYDYTAFCVKHNLQNIATCLKDLDGFIKASCKFGPPNHTDCYTIAQKYIDAFDGKSALEWLEKVQLPDGSLFMNEKYELTIQALDAMGEYEQAQNKRVEWFWRDLNPEIYIQILKHIDQDHKEEFVKKAISKAFEHEEPDQGVSFLFTIHEFEEVAKFIKLNYQEFTWHDYKILRAIAKVLTKTDALATTLIHRLLLTSVLENSKTKYYHHAGKDLETCEALSANINDWGNHDSHAVFFEKLQATHKRKMSFWHQYDAARIKAGKTSLLLTRCDVSDDEI